MIELKIDKTIVNILLTNKQDTTLCSYCCYAIASLVYNNPTNADNVLKNDIIQFTQDLMKNNLKDASLVSNICLMYNCLCFKNNETK